jgi:hypothetical protein
LLYPFPDVVAPGRRSYLVDTLSLPFAAPQELGDVRVEVAARETSAISESLAVSQVRFGGQTDDGTPVIQGVVRNDTGSVVDRLLIGGIALDRNGRIVGAVYEDAGLTPLPPGGTKRFEARAPAMPPIDEDTVAELIVVAFQRQSDT